MDRIETLAAFMAYHTKVQANTLNENVKIHNDMTNRPASEYLDKIARDISDMDIDEEDEEDEGQETDPTLSTLTVSCVQFTMGGSYHTRTGEQFDWNQWSFDIDLTRYTNEEVRSVFKEMFQTPTDIIISEPNSDYTCTVLYNVRRGFGVCLAGQNALVNDYFFIVESTSKSRGMTFGIHQFDIRGADPNLEDTMDNSGQTYDGTSTQYFADERTSSYYKSTCSGGYDEEVELTYVNHYGTCFPEIVSLIELVARFSLGIYVDEEMVEDQYY